MERREFIKGTGSALGLAGLMASGVGSAESVPNASLSYQYQLNYAPHLGMFKHLAGDDPIDQLNFMADMGFKAFEDNEMKSRSLDLQKKMAETLRMREMTMGVFVCHKIHWHKPSLSSGDADYREAFLSEVRESVEVAKRLNARWMTVVPGHVDLRQDMGYQTANVIEALNYASDILEPHDMTMVLEPLNFRNHPGLFLTKIAQAYQICKAVDSPSCKILFDVYHQQIQEGNIIPNIDRAWDEIAYFQIGDNPGRNEPTSGEINYLNIFKHIHQKGFKGILGMEHGNAGEGSEGELAVIKAYQESDRF
ncbi:hydroxypyruvate isomerase family protein [Pseudoteredinibacter isoporae]|uniref:Hydroxypyruvate isomerase n=1 Tax=Pseudoteredinibacter isoporae TaxID=570281 RepID=A0A7X0JUR5_9GAMM|nr:TIM barrel protein [Pseudoteredinibacter isoporae]MBB6522547.1 hydroxypyruvate isomerase [Pseudoteredinibacter isoporae]NHO88077.1 TIM barrel protein [Pseudoteredinibacter isoporae]NIB23592.1 TIM barrel protein [Pseudoteredinibacter isoporae]